jgi:hypothetical protein
MGRNLCRAMWGAALLALAVSSGCGQKSAVEEDAGSGAGSGSRQAAPAHWPLSYLQPKLADKRPAVRTDAALAIGRMRSEGKAAVPDLIKLLDDENSGVRTAAAEALGRIGPDAAAAVPALTKTLARSDIRWEMEPRVIAAAALGSIGPQAKPAIPELAKLLSADTELRAAAVYALWAIGPEGVEALKKDVGRAPTPAVALALKATGPNTTKVLADAVHDQLTNPEAAHWLQWAIGRTPGAAAAALPALQKALRSGGEPASRADAIIGEIGPDAKAAIPDLLVARDVSSTQDFRDRDFRAGNMGTLAELGPDAIPAVADYMYFNYWAEHEHVARALWSMGPAALPALEEGLRFQSPRNIRPMLAFVAAQGAEGQALAERVKQARRGGRKVAYPSPKSTSDNLSASARTERTRQQNKLHLIGVAMEQYEMTFMRYPPLGKDGRNPGNQPMSWRVALLSFLGHSDLYRQYRPNEPWDSPTNLKLLDQMPEFYRSRGVQASNKTSMFVFSGLETAFFSRAPIGSRDMRDGAHNTIAVVEAGPEKAVPWTKPEDLPFRLSDPRSVLGTLADGEFHVAFFDGHAETLPADIAPSLLRALITPGGEIIDRSALGEEDGGGKDEGAGMQEEEMTDEDYAEEERSKTGDKKSEKIGD